jgi:NAD+-dependent secondary alcohol dehydrogenase Adh1
MKAVRLRAYKQRPVLEEVPDPKITGPLDVIVRIGGAGLCRTDLHIIEGQWRDISKVKLPYTLGHENAGWVEAIGSGVENVKVGDTVICHPLITCGLCHKCREGDDMHCYNGVFPGIFGADGGMAEYLKTGARAVVKLEPRIKPEEVAAMADAGLSAIHPVKLAMKAGLAYAGANILVIGAGGLAHQGIQCLKSMCAATVIVSARSDASLALAKECGADHLVKADGTQVEKIKQLTGGAGCEAVLDFVAEGGSLEWGVQALRNSGTYYIIGYGGVVQVPAIEFVAREINYGGSLVGSYNELVELMTLNAQGRVTLHTKIYPLEAFNDAMDDLDNGRLHGRAIFVPNKK